MPLVSARVVLRATGAKSMLVGLSGGKDSLCTLDMVQRAGIRAEAFFMYFVKGLEVEERILANVQRRLPDLVIHRVPHWTLSNALRQGRLGAPVADVGRWQKLGDVEAYVRAQTGIDWVAYGMKASDGINRNFMLKKIYGFDAVGRRAYPIWKWTKADVYSYIRARGWPVPEVIGDGLQGGVGLHPKTLLWLRAHYPGDYRKILDVFPLAEAAVFRFEHGICTDSRGRRYGEQKRRRTQQAPGVPDGTDPPDCDSECAVQSEDH